VSRALDLGARRLDLGQGDVPWEVLADPEGNEFCVLPPHPRYDTGAVAAILVESNDPPRLGRFWSLATGWPVEVTNDEVVALRSRAASGWSSCAATTQSGARTGCASSWRARIGRR